MLSILIVNWNTRDLLARCLEAVRTSVTGLSAEIIVVDNGSADGSAQLVRERFSEVRLLTNDRNRGFALANNQAHEASRGDLVLLLNTDAVLTPEALRALLGSLTHDTKLAGAVPRLVNPDGSTQVGYHRDRVTPLRLLGAMLHNAHLWTRNPWARAYLLLDDDLHRARQVPQPAATCWLLRRSAIEAAGGLFVSAPFPIHFNDVELAERLARVGRRTVLVPAASVLHAGGATVRRLDPYLLKEHYLVSELLFFRMHRGLGEYLLLKAGFVTLCLGLLVLTALGVLRRYFTIPINDRRRSLAAQARILRSVLAERLPGTFW